VEGEARLPQDPIAVDVKQKRILALEVTDERTGDGKMLQPLVEEATGKTKVSKVLADGGYRLQTELPLPGREGG